MKLNKEIKFKTKRIWDFTSAYYNSLEDIPSKFPHSYKEIHGIIIDITEEGVLLKSYETLNCWELYGITISTKHKLEENIYLIKPELISEHCKWFKKRITDTKLIQRCTKTYFAITCKIFYEMVKKETGITLEGIKPYLKYYGKLLEQRKKQLERELKDALPF